MVQGFKEPPRAQKKKTFVVKKGASKGLVPTKKTAELHYTTISGDSPGSYKHTGIPSEYGVGLNDPKYEDKMILKFGFHKPMPNN